MTCGVPCAPGVFEVPSRPGPPGQVPAGGISAAGTPVAVARRRIGRRAAGFRIPVTPGRRGTPVLARVTGLSPPTCPSLPKAGQGEGQALPCQGRK